MHILCNHGYYRHNNSDNDENNNLFIHKFILRLKYFIFKMEDVIVIFNKY